MHDNLMSTLPHNRAIPQSHFIPAGKSACIYIKIFHIKIFYDMLTPGQND